jgi:hypothetical protein
MVANLRHRGAIPAAGAAKLSAAFCGVPCQQRKIQANARFAAFSAFFEAEKQAVSGGGQKFPTLRNSRIFRENRGIIPPIFVEQAAGVLISRTAGWKKVEEGLAA